MITTKIALLGVALASLAWWATDRMLTRRGDPGDRPRAQAGTPTETSQSTGRQGSVKPRRPEGSRQPLDETITKLPSTEALRLPPLSDLDQVLIDESSNPGSPAKYLRDIVYSSFVPLFQEARTACLDRAELDPTRLRLQIRLRSDGRTVSLMKVLGMETAVGSALRPELARCVLDQLGGRVPYDLSRGHTANRRPPDFDGTATINWNPTADSCSL